LDLNPRLKNLEYLNAKVDYTMILSLGSRDVEQSPIVVRFEGLHNQYDNYAQSFPTHTKELSYILNP
jgi:hypothetical protein